MRFSFRVESSEPVWAVGHDSVSTLTGLRSVLHGRAGRKEWQWIEKHCITTSNTFNDFFFYWEIWSRLILTEAHLKHWRAPRTCSIESSVKPFLSLCEVWTLWTKVKLDQTDRLQSTYRQVLSETRQQQSPPSNFQVMTSHLNWCLRAKIKQIQPY